jgi:ABC-type transport system involved in multi-copper enzyme maturation permease subunit
VSTLLRAELLKLRTTRTFVALVAASLGLSLLVVVLAAILTKHPTKGDVHDLFTSDFSGLFIALLGITGMAGEWRHRTITTTILAAPNRVKLLAAKVTSYALAGAVLSLVVTIAIMVAGTIILSARSLPTVGVADLADILWRNLVTAAYFGALGVCIGALVRNQVVGIVGLLIFGLAVEPALIALADNVAKFLPISGAPNALTQTSNDDHAHLSPGVALLVMLGWVALGSVASAITLERRDVV